MTSMVAINLLFIIAVVCLASSLPHLSTEIHKIIHGYDRNLWEITVYKNELHAMLHTKNLL